MLQVTDSLKVSGIGVELHPNWLNIDFFPKIFIRNYLERVRSMAGTQLIKILYVIEKETLQRGVEPRLFSDLWAGL